MRVYHTHFPIFANQDFLPSKKLLNQCRHSPHFLHIENVLVLHATFLFLDDMFSPRCSQCKLQCGDSFHLEQRCPTTVVLPPKKGNKTCAQNDLFGANTFVPGEFRSTSRPQHLLSSSFVIFFPSYFFVSLPFSTSFLCPNFSPFFLFPHNFSFASFKMLFL